MGLRSSDESGDTSGADTMDLLEQRGSLRRLVREAMGSMGHDADWMRRAEAILGPRFRNWAEYEKKL